MCMSLAVSPLSKTHTVAALTRYTRYYGNFLVVTNRFFYHLCSRTKLT